MEVLMCDHCGKVFEKFYGGYASNINRPGEGTGCTLYLVEAGQDSNALTSRRFDLCKYCSQKFAEFFAEKNEEAAR